MSSNFTDKDDFDQTKSSLSEKMVTIIQSFGKFKLLNHGQRN